MRFSVIGCALAALSSCGGRTNGPHGDSGKVDAEVEDHSDAVGPLCVVQTPTTESNVDATSGATTQDGGDETPVDATAVYDANSDGLGEDGGDAGAWAEGSTESSAFTPVPPTALHF